MAASMSGRAPGRHKLERGDRVHVIANPSTRADVSEVYRTLSHMLPAGIHMELHLTQPNDSAKSLADRLKGQSTCIIAVGGDGTVSSVAAALQDSDVLLGIVPGGSTNIIAREIGIPERLPDAARLVFGTFAVQNLDVGVCNQRHFLHMAGAGFDSLLFDLTDPALKKKVGWVAYLPAAMKALREPPNVFRLTIDDDVLEVESPLVLVANGASVINPRIKVGSRIRPDDGMLDVLVVTATRPHELAVVLARFAANAMDISPYVLYRQTRTMTLEAERPIPVQLDGDVIERTPARFSILPRSIGIIVPDSRAR